MSKNKIAELYNSLMGLDVSDDIYIYEKIVRSLIYEIKEMKDKNIKGAELVHLPSLHQVITDNILPIKETPLNNKSSEYKENISDLKQRIKNELGTMMKE